MTDQELLRAIREEEQQLAILRQKLDAELEKPENEWNPEAIDALTAEIDRLTGGEQHTAEASARGIRCIKAELHRRKRRKTIRRTVCAAACACAAFAGAVLWAKHPSVPEKESLICKISISAPAQPAAFITRTAAAGYRLVTRGETESRSTGALLGHCMMQTYAPAAEIQLSPEPDTDAQFTAYGVHEARDSSGSTWVVLTCADGSGV